MDANIIRLIEYGDYQSLNNYVKDKKDNLNMFYYAYSSYKLGKEANLISYFNECILKNEEANIIYDLLDNDNDDISLECKKLLGNKYEIHKEKPLSDHEIISISSNISISDKEMPKDNLKFYISIGVIILSLITFLINLAIIWKLKEETIYFTTILLVSFPCSMLVLGLNMLLFKKQNYLIMALEAFVLVYLVSLLMLSSHLRSDNFLINLKNHFFEVIKAIYNFAIYYTFEAVEV